MGYFFQGKDDPMGYFEILLYIKGIWAGIAERSRIRSPRRKPRIQFLPFGSVMRVKPRSVVTL